MTRQAGEYYAVTPGQGAPEFFPRTLEGVAGKHGAMQRAIGLSADGSAQQVTVTAGGITKVIFEYRDGRQTFRSCAGMIPAAGSAPVPAPEQSAEIVELASRRQRPRRPRHERASWPGVLDLNNPPCSGAN